MTYQTVNIRLPPEIHWRLAALAAEGILGRTLEEVVIHLTRNALYRDWISRPIPSARPHTSDERASPSSAQSKRDLTSAKEYISGKRLIRLREVSHIVGLSKSTIYELVQRGTFPPPKRLGERSVAWLQSEVESWITAKD